VFFKLFVKLFFKLCSPGSELDKEAAQKFVSLESPSEELHETTNIVFMINANDEFRYFRARNIKLEGLSESSAAQFLRISVPTLCLAAFTCIADT